VGGVQKETASGQDTRSGQEHEPSAPQYDEPRGAVKPDPYKRSQRIRQAIKDSCRGMN
jgi:hypothetical protein